MQQKPEDGIKDASPEAREIANGALEDDNTQEIQSAAAEISQEIDNTDHPSATAPKEAVSKVKSLTFIPKRLQAVPAGRDSSRDAEKHKELVKKKVEMVQRAQRLLVALPAQLEEMDKSRRDAAKAARAAKKRVKAIGGELEKSVGEERRKLKLEHAEEEKQEVELDRRVDAALERKERALQLQGAIASLVEWVAQQDAEDNTRASMEMLRRRVEELAVLLARVAKEMYSPPHEVVSITVHIADALEPDVDVRHPLVIVSVVDMRTGHFASKRQRFLPAVQQNECCAIREERGDGMLSYRPDPDGCSWILPVMTQPCSLTQNSEILGGNGRRWMQAGVQPAWEEEIVIDEELRVLEDKEIGILFEIVDFVAPAASDATQSQPNRRNYWKRVAWAFCRPLLHGSTESDGTTRAAALMRGNGREGTLNRSRNPFSRGTKVAPGPADSYVRKGLVGQRQRLQLYRFRSGEPRGGFRPGGDPGGACHTWAEWARGARRWRPYPAGLHVTLAERARPAQEIVPRQLGLRATLAQPVAGKGTVGQAAMQGTLWLPEALAKGEEVRVLVPVADERQIRPGATLRFVFSKPHAFVALATVAQDASSAALSFVTPVALPPSAPDAPLSFQIPGGHGLRLRGAAHGSRGVEACVVRTRALLPWQTEQELSGPGLPSAVESFRRQRTQTRRDALNLGAAGELASEGSELMPHGEFEAGGAWFRLPNTLTQRVRTGHGGCSCLAFSPNGLTLAAAMDAGSTGADSGTAYRIGVYNSVSGELIRTLPGHRGVIYDLSWAPGGKGPTELRLLSASGDRSVRVWDISTGELLSVAYLPSYAYAAQFFAHPSAKHESKAAHDLNALLAKPSKPGDVVSSKSTVGGDAEFQDLTGCSLVVTASFDSSIRIWQTCAPERLSPDPLSARLRSPTLCHIWYPERQKIQSDGLLVLMMLPSAAVQANDSVIIFLPGFSLVDLLEVEPTVQQENIDEIQLATSTNRDGWTHRAGDGDVAEWVPLRSLRMPCSPIADGETDGKNPPDIPLSLEVQAVERGVLLQLTAAENVPAFTPWAVVVPEGAPFAAPWTAEEDESILKLAGEEQGGEVSAAAMACIKTKMETRRSVPDLCARWKQVRNGRQRVGGRELTEKPQECIAFFSVGSGEEMEAVLTLQEPKHEGESNKHVGGFAGDEPLLSQRSPGRDVAGSVPLSARATGLEPTRAGERNDELDVRFEIVTSSAVSVGETLVLDLPAFRAGPTFMGSTGVREENRGQLGYEEVTWIRFGGYVSSGCALQPVCFETRGEEAELRVRVRVPCAAGTALVFSLAELFGCPARDAGVLLPRSAAKLSAGSRLAAAQSAPGGRPHFGVRRDIQRTLAVELQAPATGVARGDVVHIPAPPGFEAAASEDLHVVDLLSTGPETLSRAARFETVERRLDDSAKWAGSWLPVSTSRGKASALETSGELRLRSAVQVPPGRRLILLLPETGSNPASRSLGDALSQHSAEDGSSKWQWPADISDAASRIMCTLHGRPWLEVAQLLMTLESESSHVNAVVVVHKPLDRMFSGGSDGRIEMWDMTSTGEAGSSHPQNLKIERHTGKDAEAATDILQGAAVSSMRADKEGRWLAVLSADNAVRILRVPSLTVTHRLGGVVCVGTGQLRLDISPDGRWVSAGSADGLPRVWQVETGAPLKMLRTRFEGTPPGVCTQLVWAPAPVGGTSVAALAALGRRAPVVIFRYDAAAENASSPQAAEDRLVSALVGRWAIMLDAIPATATREADYPAFSVALAASGAILPEAEQRQIFVALAKHSTVEAEGKAQISEMTGRIDLEALSRRRAASEWSEVLDARQIAAARSSKTRKDSSVPE